MFVKPTRWVSSISFASLYISFWLIQVSIQINGRLIITTYTSDKKDEHQLEPATKMDTFQQNRQKTIPSVHIRNFHLALCPSVPSFGTTRESLFLTAAASIPGCPSHPRWKFLCDTFGGGQAGRSMDAWDAPGEKTTGWYSGVFNS